MLAFSTFELERLRQLGRGVGKEADRARDSTIFHEERQHTIMAPVRLIRTQLLYEQQILCWPGNSN